MQRNMDKDMDVEMTDVDHKEDEQYDEEGDTTTKRPPAYRQQSETVSQFLTRLPPSTTTAASVGPWIWLIQRARPDPSPHTREDIGNHIGRGAQLLRAFREKTSALRAEYRDQPQSALERKITVERKKLEVDILETARTNKILSGKWMLFPSVKTVDRVWRIVAEATAKGQLGIGAKVATDGGNSGPGATAPPRLICVYTADFADKEEIWRVLVRMKELSLFRTGEGERPIYYKCDAYTWLEIMGNNGYGLRPSMYSSTEVLKWKK
ncbi:hypothetical protein AJ79_04714 [Helicocarpus griseus UAMH5409]|uniref:DUF1917 domain-containing protein n=1 Tax=Helicocarpus griseus UAMH5409 TaxID=1447875 RepID=A0A2B7XSE5_9EURO|nr:hypothetical protein AJ79_04714 [Helicocarpus griseus UAMH5409]